MHIGHGEEKERIRGERRGKRNPTTKKPGKAGPTSQKVEEVRTGSKNVIVVNRSSTVRALRCLSIVCFSVKDGVHFSTFRDSTATQRLNGDSRQFTGGVQQ